MRNKCLFCGNFIYLGRVASTSMSSRTDVSTSSSSRLAAADGNSSRPDAPTSSSSRTDAATGSLSTPDVLNASLSGPDASTDGYSGSDTAAPHGDPSSSRIRSQAAKGFWSYDGKWFPSIRAWEKSQGRKRPRGGKADKQAKHQRR